MILWFLRQFAAYRALEAQLRERAERCISLEDQVRRLTAERDKATERADAAQRELIEALKEQAKQAQPPATDVNVRPIGRQGRAVVAEQYADYAAQFDKMLSRNH